MVFLDQEGVVESDTMVLAAANGCGIFQQPQPGNGFSGIENFYLSAGGEPGVLAATAAVADRVCSRFSAARSPLSSVRALPVRVNSF